MASCRQDGCSAAPLDGADGCWGHANEDELRPALRSLRENGRLIARRAPFTRRRLQQVLDAAPTDGSGRRTLQEADFEDCVFGRGASFERVVFAGDASFQAASFEGLASFNDAAFNGAAWFRDTRFAGVTTFERVIFTGRAWFQKASFLEGVFTDAVFDGDAFVDHAVFSTKGSFYDAWFHGDLVLTGTTAEDLQFTNVHFAGATTFADVHVKELSFVRCVFVAARQLGPLHVERKLGLDNTVWHERAAIAVHGGPGLCAVTCGRARFLAGAQLRLERTTVSLENADLAAPSIVSSAGPVEDSRPPRLLSLAGADVAGLTVSGVDLSACEFVGAYHLDQLRTDDAGFAPTPEGWRRTRRSVLAEERSWRVENAAGPGSRAAWAETAEEHRTALRPGQVAGIYRDLRKGREDRKDEPGAADFYYGEMEMRRMATGRGQRQRGDHAAVGEHAILTLYWLLAGYGLRAWRALAWLGVVGVAAGLGFAAWGIDEPGESDLPTGLLVSARAATAGLAGSDVSLTTSGAWLQLGMRLLGPVLLGLALLSIRGRVRR